MYIVLEKSNRLKCCRSVRFFFSSYTCKVDELMQMNQSKLGSIHTRIQIRPFLKQTLGHWILVTNHNTLVYSNIIVVRMQRRITAICRYGYMWYVGCLWSERLLKLLHKLKQFYIELDLALSRKCSIDQAWHRTVGRNLIEHCKFACVSVTKSTVFLAHT